MDSDRYLLTVMRYIELNPVRAGMVAEPQDYPWSSYGLNALGKSGPNLDWITHHDEYMHLGSDTEERQAAYRQLFRTAISTQDLLEIRNSIHTGWVLGGERFKLEVESLANRRAVSKGVGRPKGDSNRV